MDNYLKIQNSLKGFQLSIFALILLFSITSFGQRTVSNSIDLIQKCKVKDVFIYKTNLYDTVNNKNEILRLVFAYDTIGRLTSTQDFYKGQLAGIWYYYYNENSFKCINYDYISHTGQVLSRDTVPKNIIYDPQDERFTESSKFNYTLNSKGLYSVIIGYSKVIIEQREKGNMLDENSNPTNNYIFTKEFNEPQFILRFEYSFY
ncbi:MAG: hypothetical protein KBF32_02865 [Chitinophagales bacterium]|nr:hypothetical protein [Chitinophagales bacterium]